MKRIAGFQLIELLIAISIIGILSAIGWPVYSHHLNQKNCLEAQLVLQKLASQLERFVMEHDTYQGATLSSLGFTDDIVQHHFHLSIDQTTQTEFHITATAQNGSNTFCPKLTLNSQGERTA